MISKFTQLYKYKRNLSSMSGSMQGKNILHRKDNIADRGHPESKKPWELTKIPGTTPDLSYEIDGAHVEISKEPGIVCPGGMNRKLIKVYL